MISPRQTAVPQKVSEKTVVSAAIHPTVEKADIPLLYSDGSGQQMADHPKQSRWIEAIQKNLADLFAEQSDVWVAAELPWYPIKGDDTIRQMPSVMVVFGRPKGDRTAYRQWEERNIPPQVVFEILSPNNVFQLDRGRKLLFYNRFGVEEYYLYDPDCHEFKGWLRTQGFLNEIEPLSDWVSPRLNIRFKDSGEALQIFRPNGECFLVR